MKFVNVHAAKTGFSRLLARVEKGDEIVIARAGKPVARLVAYEKPGVPVLGVDAGAFVVPDDFNAPLPDTVLRGFEGRTRR